MQITQKTERCVKIFFEALYRGILFNNITRWRIKEIYGKFFDMIFDFRLQIEAKLSEFKSFD